MNGLYEQSLTSGDVRTITLVARKKDEKTRPKIISKKRKSDVCENLKRETEESAPVSIIIGNWSTQQS